MSFAVACPRNLMQMATGAPSAKEVHELCRRLPEKPHADGGRRPHPTGGTEVGTMSGLDWSAQSWAFQKMPAHVGLTLTDRTSV
jgi:hypothetical protein